MVDVRQILLQKKSNVKEFALYFALLLKLWENERFAKGQQCMLVMLSIWILNAEGAVKALRKMQWGNVIQFWQFCSNVPRAFLTHT